ncbi:MAG: carboxypeptidase-like regulatory domain-containing protein [Terriglobia bacterium]
MGGASEIRRLSFPPLLLSLLLCATATVTTARAHFPFLPDSGGIESPPPAAQRIPGRVVKRTAAVQGVIREEGGRPLAGVNITLRQRASNRTRRATTNGEGVFRLGDLSPGMYTLKAEKKAFEPLLREDFELRPSEVRILELTLRATAPAEEPVLRLPRLPELGPVPPTGPEPEGPAPPYRELRRRPDAEPAEEIAPTKELPPEKEVFIPLPDRWGIAFPEWDRYGKGGEFPYTKGHWWDPFNVNKLKGDYPIIGQRTFFNFAVISDTLFDGRRVPVPSNVSAARPGSVEFFGRPEQFFFNQNFRFSFDLFHGDTAFRPFDWRVRVTPALSINYVNTREQGIVNIDVREGTNRTDFHIGLQEAFFEAKLRDLSPNFDFVSVRAGIQPFSSDFRGFIFVDEQPGIRFFGNLHSNRWEYNLAYFALLEKDTNSVLNTFDYRHQQVFVANLYLQDFIFLGYTTQFSLHYNKDDADFRFDTNEFLVRPAPIGAVKEHDVRVGYLGWTGNGHIGRLNISHAFYQAFGDDDLNPISGGRIDINAQMAAVELSFDKDWVRPKASFLWASGDSDPRDEDGRGFDAIVDFPVFAGGIFSYWNSQGLRLTGTGVALVNPKSFFPTLRPNKEQGQANFVNPGIFLFNVGTDVELTPKLRTLINVNWMRFHRTETFELLDFQGPIRPSLGWDYSVGFQYRPPLTENIILTGGLGIFSPGGGFRDLLTSQTLFSLFTELRLQF